MPTGVANEKLTTRQDKVFDFLRDPQANFLAELEKKNPVTVYRFGSRLDEDYLQFAGGKTFTKQERENPVRTEEGTIVPPEATTFTEEYWRAFLNPGMKVEAGALADADLRALREARRPQRTARQGRHVARDEHRRLARWASSTRNSTTASRASSSSPTAATTKARPTPSATSRPAPRRPACRSSSSASARTA